MANVAFIGLGVMGYPMAGHLQRAGHQVTVYNRTAEKAARWVQEYGGRFADTPASAARGQDFVLLCVGNDTRQNEWSRNRDDCTDHCCNNWPTQRDHQ